MQSKAKSCALNYTVAVTGCVRICVIYGKLIKPCIIYTICTKVLGNPLVMKRFDYFSNFHEYKS